MLKASIQRNRALNALFTAQNSNVLNDNISLVSKVAAHTERAVVVRESNHRCGRLLDAIAIIEVQGASSLVSSIRCNPQDEVLLAQLCCRVCGFGAERQNRSTADVQRDSIETDVREVDHGSGSLDALAGPVVVEDFVGQVDGHGCRVFFQHGRNEDSVAVEELVLDGEGVGVGGVVEPQWVQTGYSSGGLAVEGSVEIVKQSVAYCNSILSRRRGQWPAVVFLVNRCVSSVVPHEGVESTKCCPTRAESLGGVACETANIGSDHGDLVDGVEVQDASDGEAILRPF